jgi:hypothetical protein
MNFRSGSRRRKNAASPARSCGGPGFPARVRCRDGRLCSGRVRCRCRRPGAVRFRAGRCGESRLRPRADPAGCPTGPSPGTRRPRCSGRPTWSRRSHRLTWVLRPCAFGHPCAQPGRGVLRVTGHIRAGCHQPRSAGFCRRDASPAEPMRRGGAPTLARRPWPALETHDGYPGRQRRPCRPGVRPCGRPGVRPCGRPGSRPATRSHCATRSRRGRRSYPWSWTRATPRCPWSLSRATSSGSRCSHPASWGSRVPQPRSPTSSLNTTQTSEEGRSTISGATLFKVCPAASYSPTRSPAQYHRR